MNVAYIRVRRRTCMCHVSNVEPDPRIKLIPCLVWGMGKSGAMASIADFVSPWSQTTCPFHNWGNWGSYARLGTWHVIPHKGLSSSRHAAVSHVESGAGLSRIFMPGTFVDIRCEVFPIYICLFTLVFSLRHRAAV